MGHRKNVYLSPSHFSHYLLMLWRGRRFYDDRRPKIVSSHPLLSLWCCFLLLPPSTHPHPAKPPRRTAHFTVGHNPEGCFLSLSLYLSLPSSPLSLQRLHSDSFYWQLVFPWQHLKTMATIWTEPNALSKLLHSSPPPLSERLVSQWMRVHATVGINEHATC